MTYCTTLINKVFHRVKFLLKCSCYRLIRLIIFLILLLVAGYIVSACFYSLYCSYRFHQGLAEADKRQLWSTREGVQGRFMPILIPVCDRPLYLKRVLYGLSKVDGINETLIVVSQDCAQSPVSSLLSSSSSDLPMLILRHTPPFFSLPGYVHSNEYATSANVKFLLEFAFEHMQADGAILLESDLIPSVDFYRYHQWTYRTLLAPNASDVLSVHCFNLRSTNASDAFTLFPRGFDSWGWSTARTRWPWFKQHWTRYHAWDTIVSQSAKRDGWKCMLPKLSRTRMIGLKGINVNVKTESERKQFEENMFMSETRIDYQTKKPNIVAA